MASVFLTDTLLPPPPSQVLKRGIFVDRSSDGSLRDLREECSAVQWKEGQNLTVKEVKKGGKGKKGKKGGKGGREEGGEEGPVKKKYRACSSFFRWVWGWLGWVCRPVGAGGDMLACWQPGGIWWSAWLAVA